MFGAIEAGALIEEHLRAGFGIQQELDLPLDVQIKEEYLTSSAVEYRIGKLGYLARVDHPAFAELRKILIARGYVTPAPYPCWNGDTVEKDFYFNGRLLRKRETFYCASAWGNKFKVRKEYANT